MTRRARSQFSPAQMVFGVALILVIACVGIFVFSGSDSTYRTLPSLDVDAYLENANSLRGNTYQIEGAINHSLAWSSTIGRLFSVRIGKGRDVRLLPVFIPADLNEINVQRGQSFHFKIEVVENGLIRVLEMKKS